MLLVEIGRGGGGGGGGAIRRGGGILSRRRRRRGELVLVPVRHGRVDGALKIWNANVGGGGCGGAQITTQLRWHASPPLVFCGYTDGVVFVWDVREGRLKADRDVWLDCMVHFGFSRWSHLPVLFMNVSFVRTLNEKMKERRFHILVFIFGALYARSMFVFGVGSTLFGTIIGIICGIAGFFCALKTTKDKSKYVADIMPILKAFNTIDTNNDGKISREELQAHLNTDSGYFLLRFLTDRSNETPGPEQAVDIIFKKLDSDRDGKISATEFVYQMMLRGRS